MYGMYFLFVVFLYCNLLQHTKVEGLLLPFLYIHTCVIFNKCIQTLKVNVIFNMIPQKIDQIQRLFTNSH